MDTSLLSRQYKCKVNYSTTGLSPDVMRGSVGKTPGTVHLHYCFLERSTFTVEINGDLHRYITLPHDHLQAGLSCTREKPCLEGIDPMPVVPRCPTFIAVPVACFIDGAASVTHATFHTQHCLKRHNGTRTRRRASNQEMQRLRRLLPLAPACSRAHLSQNGFGYVHI